MGGGDKTASTQIAQNRAQINQTGNTLNQNAQGAADAYGALAQRRVAQADDAYAPLLAGQGGYTPEQIAAIQNKEALESLRTSPDALKSNYLTDTEQGSIMGDQSGIRRSLGDVNAAVDPASVADFEARTRLTPEQQQAMATSAARDQSLEARSTMDHNIEAARSAGMDPLGIASYASRSNRQAQIDAANAAASARVAAGQEAAGREQNILGAHQTLAQQRAAAANTQLTSETGMENAASQRAAAIAGNRQTTNQSNQGTQYSQGQYIEGQNAGRAAGVADTNLAASKEGRDYLTSQGAQNIGAGLAEQGIQNQVYGTQTGGEVASTNSQIEADKKPAWWQSLLSAGAQVGAAAVKH